MRRPCQTTVKIIAATNDIDQSGILSDTIHIMRIHAHHLDRHEAHHAADYLRDWSLSMIPSIKRRG